MDSATVSALVALNRRFYERCAAEFDATRKRPWPGWKRVLERLPGGGSRRLSVLDLGCGNGRFASFLAEAWTGPVDYLGLDGSEALLAAAGEPSRGLAGSRLRAFEILTESLDEALGGRRFDLAAVFGVLHHVPGEANRRALVRDLGARLSPSGVLAVSVWQLHRDPGFARKTVPWKRYNRHRQRLAAPALHLGELEAGDYLLSWKGRDDPPRYCHFPETAEVEGWIAASGLRLLDRYEADGPTGADNLYLLLERGNRNG
jgi:SAM-dependent methyltransferase